MHREALLAAIGERTVVTISRQTGSLSHNVAGIVAARLGYRLVWREVINQAARRAGAPEAALAAIDDLGLLGICPSPKACLAYRQAVKQIMEELADRGSVVIMGRAGQVILGGRPDVLHVRLFAPQQVRIERVSARQGISLECAQAQLEASDRSRRSYLRRFYHARWDDPDLYDLIINTNRVPPEAAAELICYAVKHWQVEALREPSQYDPAVAHN
jgi:cytidylate kinase